MEMSGYNVVVNQHCVTIQESGCLIQVNVIGLELAVLMKKATTLGFQNCFSVSASI